MGFRFVVGDYPQIEVRVIAELAQDENMMRAFREGVDIYKATAAGMNGVSIEDVDKQMRSFAKPLVLGLQFGLGASKLGRYAFLNYGVSLENPEASRDDFFCPLQRAEAMAEGHRHRDRKARDLREPNHPWAAGAPLRGKPKTRAIPLPSTTLSKGWPPTS